MTKDQPQDFLIVTSFDFIDYDENDVPRVNEAFQAFLDSISLSLDVRAIDEYYFKQDVGTGDVYLYTISANEFVVFELYRGMDDQCDIISIGLRVGKDNVEKGTRAMRSLYDQAYFMVSYSQSWKCDKLTQLADIQNYPKSICGYDQKIHVNHMGFLSKNA